MTSGSVECAWVNHIKLGKIARIVVNGLSQNGMLRKMSIGHISDEMAVNEWLFPASR